MAESGYTTKLASSLKDLQEQSELCDIIINIGNTPFHAHKAVLAASSDYFRAMFSHGFREGTASEINIDGNPKIFQVLLQYAYTGKMNIIPKAAFDIVNMACYLQFTDVLKYISESMKLSNFTCSSEKIEMSDVLKIYYLAKDHNGLKDVIDEAVRYFCENIQELKMTEEFLETSDFMDEFLNQENLFCDEGEKGILDLVVTWLKHDWETRHIHTFGLLQKVHLGLIPAESLTELLNGKILEKRKCQELFKKVIKLQDSGKSDIQLSIDNPRLFGARTGSKINVPIMLSKDETFDNAESDVFKFYYFNSATKEWKCIDEYLQPPPQEVTSLFVVGSTLYAVGGRDENLPNVENMAKHWFRFDSEQNFWDELPRMNTPKDVDTFPMVYLKGFIYTIGGCYFGVNNDVEHFDAANDTWEMLAPIPRQRESRCSSALVCDGRILVFVIHRPHIRAPTKHTILAYDPGTDIWQTAYSRQYGNEESQIIMPVLFDHDGVLYRVMFIRPTDGQNDCLQIPKVNVMNVRISRNVVRVTEGEEINQDLIPVNTMGAFRIQDEVFLNVNGFVAKTDLKITDGQNTDVDLKSWKKFPLECYQTYFLNSNIVYFSLDRKLFD